MFYFDNEEHVEKYIEMVKGFDGSDLIDKLKQFLPKGASVLELGMGPGVDLAILQQTFQATGSDRSAVFVNRYLNAHPGSDAFKLDAITMDTERQFDCIYSNKVLHHLTREELIQSLQNQKKNLHSNGILIHSFWYGHKTETHNGLLFNYYQEGDLEILVKQNYKVIKMERYTEMEENDSIYIILRKK